ncbi:WAS/WASL-interacting protein family member 3-like [Schistocerca gregaria]|uniref:WAS/WASL-interacting protein family member 3-like n=1 Tax=Schistocerca cancellata TaxID=274614 RepID=UPI0021188797|nr:WAS/WASL-interacting protein family member 3-like [Schistocerca cancellata]XP_049832165.1 WAS/WASL-interacting protein family member 3-like [Schistocerca gregaria]
MLRNGTPQQPSKKPHMLPPLEKRRSSVEARAEVGTPPPRCFKPSLEELRLLKEPPAEGRPAIRLTRCSEPPTPPTPPSPPPPPPAPPTVLGAGRYAPLEPIKRRDSSQI